MAKRPRTSWYQRISRTLKTRVDAAIATGAQSWSEIYTRWNLQRYTAPSSFRRYMAVRRRYAKQGGARARGQAAAAVLYAFGLPATTARRHGVEVGAVCAECGRPASLVVAYSTGQCHALCRADFSEFVGGLLPSWLKRGRP